ncbi:MAG: ClbS/DfsB family four-helix bundle protein [Chloroflexi bacterium]|nr:ClbS/DfsB family four-helix bundle protein [Chloroflexota bacterium]
MDTAQLLSLLRDTRKHLQALIDAAGQDGMDAPGVSDDYSLKDIVAHLLAYERALVTWLDVAGAGRVYVDPVVDRPDLDARNAVVYAANHGRPAAEVAQEYAQTAADLEARVAALSYADLNDAEASAWFVVPRWGRPQALWQCIVNDSVEHRQQHLPDIERWLAARGKASR